MSADDLALADVPDEVEAALAVHREEVRSRDGAGGAAATFDYRSRDGS